MYNLEKKYKVSGSTHEKEVVRRLNYKKNTIFISL